MAETVKTSKPRMSLLGFNPEAKVVVEEIHDKNWKVREPFSYTGNSDIFRIECGAETDFASVPRVFVWFLPRYGRYTLAAILHDHLWRKKAATGAMEYIDADGIFRQAMRELNVPFLRRWIMWAAVRWGALCKPGGRRGWWREGWRVLLVTGVALPILLPPAMVIALALSVFYLVEFVAWVPLKLVHWIKRSKGRASVKRVNRPTLDWRL